MSSLAISNEQVDVMTKTMPSSCSAHVLDVEADDLLAKDSAIGLAATAVAKTADLNNMMTLLLLSERIYRKKSRSDSKR